MSCIEIISMKTRKLMSRVIFSFRKPCIDLNKLDCEPAIKGRTKIIIAFTGLIRTIRPKRTDIIMKLFGLLFLNHMLA
tara:strand:+ start:266 stop:499 length:234 start_codon:yes stop_codon:yes gene_type:complete